MLRFSKSHNVLAGRLIVTVGALIGTGAILFGLIFIKYREVLTVEKLVLITAFFVATISVLLCTILYYFVSKPVALLEAGMKRIAAGELGQPIEINSSDEMGLLARTLNSMSADMKLYHERMEDAVSEKTRKIMEAQEELINAEKLASLGRMAAGVAHEINSPLTGIITFAHLVKDRLPAEDGQIREDVQVIIDQANRCSAIIKGLLGFARRTDFEVVDLDLNVLIRTVVDMVKKQARFHNIRLDMALDYHLQPARADANQLQQVFLNLLINAADAMNEKGSIFISTRSLKGDGGRGMFEIEFTDSGPGIPEEHINKIFEPFFTTKPVGKGTGLGLAVSYGIIKKYGGDIIVKSAPGKGASFFIRLPMQGEAK
ncbi:MAG: ATP-binding protein [Nitrospiraceae bacterium]|nr:ATP-binding protein [Nitrospiraceae bacterium]